MQSQSGAWQLLQTRCRVKMDRRERCQIRTTWTPLSRGSVAGLRSQCIPAHLVQRLVVAPCCRVCRDVVDRAKQWPHHIRYSTVPAAPPLPSLALRSTTTATTSPCTTAPTSPREVWATAHAHKRQSAQSAGRKWAGQWPTRPEATLCHKQ